MGSLVQGPKIQPFYSLEQTAWLLWPNDGREPDRREPLRQWLLRELVETYGYPADWLGTRIILIEEPKQAQHDGLFGFCVLTADRIAFLWAAVEEPRDVASAEKALRHALLTSPHAGLGVLSDGSAEHTRFVRRRFDSDKCEYIVDLEPYRAPGESSPASQLSFLNTAAARGQLAPLNERVENVFFEVHSHIRDIDGFHSDEALDEVCKVLYAKFFDEEQTPEGSPYRAQRWIYGNAEEFAASMRHLYQEANGYDSRVFSLKIPGYQRSRGVFSSPIRLSSPALVKAVETLQEYTLTGTATDIKGRAFQKVLGPALRAGMGQYFTPDPIIRFAVRVAGPSINDLVLDPFCGSAHFLTRSLQFVRSKTADASSKAFHEFAFGKLHGIEKSDRMVRVAMTDMRLHGDGHSNIRCTDSLLSFENYADIFPESFDLILTNPPFGCLLAPEAISQLGKFELAYGRKSVPLEVLGLERCIQFLRPGGRLGIVLPDGLLANRNSRHVREWLERQAKVRGVVSLPIETFAPFGANVKTSILFLRKWRKGEQETTAHPVFMASADNVGYDSAGRLRDSCDLDPLADEFADFLEKEGW